jgi:hypothetical protein
VAADAAGAEAVYRLVGDHAEPTSAAAGPWDADHQHGAAPAALVAWAAERLETDRPMRVARLTLDLVRPVPVAPLEIRTEIVRQGRKIQTAAIRLLSDGVEVVRATVLKVRVGAPAPRGADLAPELELTPPERATALRGPSRTPRAFLDGISIRIASGDPASSGPAAIWFRADRPLIEGEQTTPLMRAALTADFSNGASAPVDPREWTFINADLTLSVTRAPVGDWILLDAETWLGRDGVALASVRLADTTGYFGRAAQSLLIEPLRHRTDS